MHNLFKDIKIDKKVRNIFISLFVGLLVAYLTLLATQGSNMTGRIIKGLWDSSFNNIYTGKHTVNKVVGLAFVGLAVAVGMKGKILNIGVSGQMTFGAALAYMVLNKFDHGLGATFFLGLIISVFGAVLLALIVGILKVFFKVNEVVSSIMMNWVVVMFIAYNETHVTAHSLQLSQSHLLSGNTTLFTIMGIIMLLLSASALWFMFYKTIFGHKVIVSGQSPSGAEYAGYNFRINNLYIFALSGAVSGLAGFVYFFISKNGIPTSLTPYSAGFTGIAVSLVGLNNPIGVIFSGMLFTLLEGPFEGLSIDGIDARMLGIFASVVTYFVAITALWNYIEPIKWYKLLSNKFAHYKEVRNSDKIKGGKNV